MIGKLEKIESENKQLTMQSDDKIHNIAFDCKRFLSGPSTIDVEFVVIRIKNVIFGVLLNRKLKIEFVEFLGGRLFIVDGETKIMKRFLDANQIVCCE